MAEQAQPEFRVTDQFDPAAMQAFRRRPDIYWAGTDALSPPPESLDFITHMLHPDIWTVAGTLGGHIFGYVEFNRRTSVGAEVHASFHPQFRGAIARSVFKAAIREAFSRKGLLKLWGPIPSDNRAALMGARLCGFREEGRLIGAVVRDCKDGGPPLRDLVIMALSKTEFH
jgi:RimJ/RimL family protein N-acetyltransferase